MRRKIAVPVIIALVIVGFGGLALAYFPAWGHHLPYYWAGNFPPGEGPRASTPSFYRMGPYAAGPMYGPAWGPAWGVPMAPFSASRLRAVGEALSKATGIPLEKLKSVWQKYPMPPRMFLRAVVLSQLLKKDLETVAKDFSANPPLYLWKSGIDPSQLIKKEWELMGKIEPVLKGWVPFRGGPMFRGWGMRMW